MKIETKFRPFDEVYFIIFVNNKWSVHKSQIKAIVIYCGILIVINYLFNGYEIQEQDCFNTKAEAQAECYRRNNGR